MRGVEGRVGGARPGVEEGLVQKEQQLLLRAGAVQAG